MIEFITQYWLEVLFGLITAGFGFFCKRYYNLYKESQKTKKNEFWDEVKQAIMNEHQTLVDTINEREAKLEEEDTNLKESINEINKEVKAVTDGVLSIQGRAFKDECRLLLEDAHHITLAEYEFIAHEYRTYKGLGGNSNGDGLFNLVKLKYENQLKDD